MNHVTDTPPSAASARSSLWLWACLAVVAGLVLVYVATRTPQGGESHPAVGQQLEKLDLEPLVGEGDPATLESLRGKVSLINYWSLSCPPCLLEFPHMAALEKKYRDRDDFRFFSVSCDAAEGQAGPRIRDLVQAHLEKVGTDMTVYYDPRYVSRQSVAKTAKMQGFSIPLTVLVGRQGAIRGLWIGYQSGDEERIEQAVRQQLDGDE